jgi:ERCC4-type nuclease
MIIKQNLVNDTELTYEIILSKGLGNLTKKSEKMIYILVQRAIEKTRHKFNNDDDVDDGIQASYLKLLIKWQGFNLEKATSAFAYLSEIHKRAVAEYLNNLYKIKGLSKEEASKIKLISMNSSNNGQGLYNI